MTDTLHYKLELSVSDGTDIQSLEELMQSVLLDLYENDGVESIKVTKDGYVTTDEDLEALVENIEDIESEHIKQAIDVVKAMEKQEYDDDG